MDRNQFKALLFTSLIFGSIGYYLFGDKIDITWPKLDLWEKFTKKSDTKSADRKTRKNISSAKTGQVIDSYRGVEVFYNGAARNVFGRNTTKDGYNLGLKYQCVEFAKRFFYDVYNHKMPDSYGHARDFFDKSLAHKAFNKKRGLYQYKNRQYDKPKPNDLCVIGPSPGNQFGHLFIITKVTNSEVEFIQQNGGVNNPSRGNYELVNEDGTWNLKVPHLLGWLRMH